MVRESYHIHENIFGQVFYKYRCLRILNHDGELVVRAVPAFVRCGQGNEVS